MTFTKTDFVAFSAATLCSCTGQIPNSFSLTQQEETFSSQQRINTKIDLLWVVDNSASMDVEQQRLRNGFSSFAQKYMQPTWDIRVAVITTDTYLAHPAFAAYLNSTIAHTTGWKSPYINSRLSTFVNPASNPTLVNLSTGVFDAGVKFSDLIPTWKKPYSRLLPGIHDGPITALCSELLPFFFKGATDCATRDNQALYNGATHCLNPSPTSGETSLTQCVNTAENDSIHSGKAIISTMPPTGVSADASWSAQLVHDFLINVTTGSAGSGSERGMGSVLQLIQDNETSPTAFFRPGSLRGIIFISDEEDQTMTLPSAPPAGFRPESQYACDQASLVAANGAARITGLNGFCCANPANNCFMGSAGTSCPAKTVDGLTYTIGICPVGALLVPVSNIKSQLDTFFKKLDGVTTTDPNYFVASIVPMTGNSIQSLQTARDVDDIKAGSPKMATIDRGDRYIELGTLVGNGSLAMNIADEDYTPILNAIGNAIISKKSTFTLTRAPTGSEDMIVKVLHADGTATIITASQYLIQEKLLVVTDSNLILSLKATDNMFISYQPKTVY